MKIIFKWGLGLLLILFLAAIIIPFLVPASTYKSAIETQISDKINRQLSINGDVSISPFPVLKAKSGQVTIANANGFKSDNFASMEGMYVRIKLLPLLSKKVEVAAFELREPVINLEKRKDGSVNWILGSQDQNQPSAGPFKRDGRFVNLDPTIGNFRLHNGKISYSDASSGVSHILDNVNLSFELPSLDKEVTLDGDLKMNGLPVDIEFALDTPRSFLNGKKTPVTIASKTEFGSFNATGFFSQSADVHFVLDVKSTLNDLNPIKAYIPENLPIAGIVENLDLSGLYSFDGKILKAERADIKTSGQHMSSRFIGNADIGATPVLDGDIDLNISNVPELSRILELDIEGSQLVQSAAIKAKLNAKDAGFESQNISANISGEGLSASFTGNGSYNGKLQASGSFTSSIRSIPTLINALSIDVPQASALGNATANGTLNLEGETLDVKISEARTDGENLRASYQGQISKIGEKVSIDGLFDSNVPSLSRLATASNTEIPHATTIETIAATGRITGGPGNLSFSDLEIGLRDGQINGTFSGAATLNDSFDLNGFLDAEIPSARKLAANAGTQLPPSTASGTIYERVALKGQVTGNPAAIKFADADLVLDAINGGGNFSLDLTSSRPEMTGTLDLGQLDLRPYMAAYTAQKAGQGIQPWSREPINFAALRAMDGNYTIKTPEVLFGRLKMGQTDIDAKVRNGILTARLPEINLYGGLGVMTATVDASGDLPKVKMDVRLEDITTNRFLSSIANFTKLEGTGHTLLEISGEGRSQDEIMKSLDGYGDFEVLNGVISGIDLSQFLGGIEQTLASRAIPKGLGKSYATKFDDIVGKFKIKDGVVSIDSFNLKAFDALASGSGKLDIGNQSVDFGLRPRLTGSSASDFAKFGIPLRLKGNWGSIGAGLDTDMLTNIAAEQAKLRAKKEITNRVGSGLGDVLGSVLGVPKETEPVSENTEGTSNTTSSSPAQTIPSNPQPKTNVVDVISDIIGSESSNSQNETETTQTPETDAAETKRPDPEPQKELGEQLIEEALGGLFGSKKKKEEAQKSEDDKGN